MPINIDRGEITILTITNENIGELSHLQEYTSLLSLECNGHNLATLPNLPNTLCRLSCCNNRLTKLPPLPNALLYLACSFNNLMQLPDVLPPFLQELICNGTKRTWYHKVLTRLPDHLPDTLRLLVCDDNVLTYLPELPTSLETLGCADNQLTYLPMLPDTLKHFWCQGNPFERGIFPDKVTNTNGVSDYIDPLEIMRIWQLNNPPPISGIK